MTRDRRAPAGGGALVYDEALDQGLRPDPLLTVSEWADRHRRLSGRAAAEPGPWRTSRTPYLKEIMDCLSPASPVERVVLCKGAQIGATEAGNNWIGYVIHHAPGPMLAVMPTVEGAKRNSRGRIDPLIEESPALRARVRPARSRDAGNTMLSKEFPGGVLVMTGANSAVGLRSMPARYLFLDEIDGYPGDVDGEGDPIALAEARTSTFARRKIFLASTPTLQGLSRIERAYEASDQRRYFVPCPHCGTMQWLRFERLRWEKGRPETVAYHCEGCEQPIEERHKASVLPAGEWRATATGDGQTAGFHLSALYAPLGWRNSWAVIAAEHEAARGSDAAMKSFKNTRLGETWFERGEAPEWERLYERREQWPVGTVPAGGVVLTAGADTQRDRIEVDVWAWGRGLESWLVDHIVIERQDEAAAWAALEALLGREWEHAGGGRLRIARLAIDVGDNETVVHPWAKRVGYGQVSPVQGERLMTSRSHPVMGPTNVGVTINGRKRKRGARLWHVQVSIFKTETYRWLRLERPTDAEIEAGTGYPAGTIHLPRWVDDEWVKQLVAEHLVTVKLRGGFTKLEWRKMRERNEALDCRVYARAAAWIMGLDHWSEARWDEEAGMASPPRTPPATMPEAAAAEAQRTPSRRGGWLDTGRRGSWL